MEVQAKYGPRQCHSGSCNIRCGLLLHGKGEQEELCGARAFLRGGLPRHGSLGFPRFGRDPLSNAPPQDEGAGLDEAEKGAAPTVLNSFVVLSKIYF